MPIQILIPSGKRDTRVGNDRQATSDPDIRAAVFSLLRARIHAYLSHYRLHRMQITGRVLVTSVGARARACAHTRMRSIRHCLPTSPQASKWMPSRGIVHHRGSLSTAFFTHLTEATDSIREKEIKDDATYESRCDFPRLRRWACLETTAREDGIEMIRSDCYTGILCSTICYCFDVSFFFIFRVDIFSKRANFIIWKLFFENWILP